MYITKWQRVAYTLSRIKSLFFDKIVAWVAENLDTITMLRLFNKTKHWMGVHLQGTEAKQELITIAIKNTESVSKYYHRIFKLWTRANTPINERIVKFTRLLKPSISTPLLSRKFTSISAVLDEARDIKDALKKSRTRFPDKTIGSSLFQNSPAAPTHKTLQLVEALQLVKALRLVKALEKIRNPQPSNRQSGLARDTIQTQNLKSSNTTIRPRFCAKDAAGHAMVQAIVGVIIAVQSSRSSWI